MGGTEYESLLGKSAVCSIRSLHTRRLSTRYSLFGNLDEKWVAVYGKRGGNHSIGISRRDDGDVGILAVVDPWR